MGRRASWWRSIISSGVRWPAVRSWRSRAWRCPPEDPHLAQQPVAGRAVASGRAVHLSLGVQQLQNIPDGDAVQRAAPGGQDDRGPAQRVTAGGFGPAGSLSHRARSRAKPSGSRSAAMVRASSP